MPIIRFTESDKLAAIVADAGWYIAVVKAIDMKASSTEKSVSFWTDFEIVSEGKFKGKELKCCFNTKTSNVSLLGGMQFRPYSDLTLLYAAIYNIPLADVPLELDTDDLLLKEFDLQVVIDTEGGVLKNVLGGFFPAGKATSASSAVVAF